MSICVQCRGPIDRRAARGPIPSYCSARCRQQAFRDRQKTLQPALNSNIVEPDQTSIITVSGTRVDLANPTADMIRLGDIAHSLPYIYRYNGQVPEQIDVAQHCCLVHDILCQAWNGHDDVRLWALLHDAHEAYTGDIVRPLKRMLGHALIRVEVQLDWAIMDAFNIPPLTTVQHDIVHQADMVVYAWERHTVAYVDGCWDVPDVLLPEQPIVPWSPEQSRDEFLSRFNRYRPEILL